MKDQFRIWPEHFRISLDNKILPSDPEGYSISAEERKVILRSIQQFQDGENSEGKHLIATSTLWSLRTGNPSYARAIQLFIKEEQQHACMLGHWMQGQGIPLKQGHWSDKAFTFLRRLGGIETSISVLLTVELISPGYYKALRDATNSSGLKEVCERILKDEQHHITFQSQALATFSVGRSGLGIKLHTLFRRFLLAGTLLAVWLSHKQVYKAGGTNFLQTWNAAFAEFDHSLDMIQTFRKEVPQRKRVRISTAFIYLAHLVLSKS